MYWKDIMILLLYDLGTNGEVNTKYAKILTHIKVFKMINWFVY